MCSVITLTSCSSGGKDSILNAVLRVNSNIKPIISITTRPMREGEIQDREYHFKSYDEVKQMLHNNEFIEHRSYKVANGEEWIYGIHKSEINPLSNETKIVIVDYTGLKELQKYCYENDIEVKSYYIECNPRERLFRSLQREPNANGQAVVEHCRRLIDDEINVTPAKDICTVLKNETNQDFVDAVIEISKEVK